MELWLLSRKIDDKHGDILSTVVAAQGYQTAKHTHPSGDGMWDDERQVWVSINNPNDVNTCNILNNVWVNPNDIKVTPLGNADEITEQGVVVKTQPS